MSAIEMGRQAAKTAVGTLSGDQQQQPDFLGRLVEYLPADIVAGYVAVYALANGDDASFRQEWIVAWVFLALTPLVVWGMFAKQYKNDTGSRPSLENFPLLKVFVAVIAYAAWVFALPRTPVLDWGDVTGFAQTLVLVVVTIGLTSLGNLVGD